MGLTQVRFDIFEQGDLAEFNELLSNPKIVIEKQTMQFVSVPPDDPDEEYEERLMLTVLFSKYDEDVNMNNLFKKAILKIVPEYNSNGYIEYQKFIKSEMIEIINETTAYNGKTALNLITYIDKRYNVNREFSINKSEAEEKGMYFDIVSGQFIME
jgi:hypothetical protein